MDDSDGGNLKIHIVTASLGFSEDLNRTARSVFAQTVFEDPKVFVSYSLRISKGDAGDFTEAPTLPNLILDLVVQDDDGLYDALADGFEACDDADIYCYLGAGDLFSPYALEIVAQCISDDVPWLTGLLCGYNEKGHLVEAQVPFRYRSALIKAGFYGSLLPFIQQESTFWSAALHRTVPWQQLRIQRLAGDALLWRSFAEHASLVVIECWLGGFARQPGQLSDRYAGRYREEFQALSLPPRWHHWLQACIDWFLWRAPRRIKRLLDPARYVYEPGSGRYLRLDQHPATSSRYQR